MLCELCTSVGRMRVGELPAPSRRNSVDGVSLTCDACGKPLGATVGDRVVQTLRQLARFGLTGQSILARRRA